MIRRSLLLGHAVAAALALSQQERAAPAPEVADPSPTLDKLRVIPVDPGHPREPSPQRFEIDRDQGVVYVRRADWPKLEQALRKRKAGHFKVDVQSDAIEVTDGRS